MGDLEDASREGMTEEASTIPADGECCKGLHTACVGEKYWMTPLTRMKMDKLEHQASFRN